jgi:hypothetical protein
MPKLVREQFSHSEIIGMTANFASKRIEVTYKNIKKLDYADYKIKNVSLNGSILKNVIYFENRKGIRISLKELNDTFDQNSINRILIVLD